MNKVVYQSGCVMVILSHFYLVSSDQILTFEEMDKELRNTCKLMYARDLSARELLKKRHSKKEDQAGDQICKHEEMRLVGQESQEPQSHAGTRL